MTRNVRLALLAAVAICAGCYDNDKCRDLCYWPPAPVYVTVTPDSLDLFVGAKTTIKAVVENDTIGGDLRGVTWSSTSPLVASVDQTGFVTALSAGTTAIIARSKLRVQRSDVAIVVVTELPSDCVMFLRPSTAAMTPGAKIQLTAPACVGPITWLSSNAAIASVNATGEVTGLKGGIVHILATPIRDSRMASTSQITVYDAFDK